jgi:hypothetical protein
LVDGSGKRIRLYDPAVPDGFKQALWGNGIAGMLEKVTEHVHGQGLQVSLDCSRANPIEVWLNEPVAELETLRGHGSSGSLATR